MPCCLKELRQPAAALSFGSGQKRVRLCCRKHPWKSTPRNAREWILPGAAGLMTVPPEGEPVPELQQAVQLRQPGGWYRIITAGNRCERQP